jgi:hypothetical protein
MLGNKERTKPARTGEKPRRLTSGYPSPNRLPQIKRDSNQLQLSCGASETPIAANRSVCPASQNTSEATRAPTAPAKYAMPRRLTISLPPANVDPVDRASPPLGAEGNVQFRWLGVR